LYHTAEGAHIEGVDFAGKTGTAQVVGGGDTHNAGGAKTPNSWFVGMVPRRNPEVSVVVLQEHGDWGSNSAKIAQAIITVYVNKKRRQDHNLMQQAGTTKPVEVSEIWSTPAPPDPKHPSSESDDVLHLGHFLVSPSETAAAIAGRQATAESLFAAVPLRRRERQP
jgi:penicillin-binding protein 2